MIGGHEGSIAGGLAVGGAADVRFVLVDVARGFGATASGMVGLDAGGGAEGVVVPAIEVPILRIHDQFIQFIKGLNNPHGLQKKTDTSGIRTHAENPMDFKTNPLTTRA